MVEDREQEAGALAAAIGVVDSPRVVAVECRPCRDELGLEALEVHVVLEAERDGPDALAAGARAIWEAALERLTSGEDGRFPYVRFHLRPAPGEGAERR
jgi:hypothetical protein